MNASNASTAPALVEPTNSFSLFRPTMGHPAQPVATLDRKHHDEDRRNEESHNGNGIKGHGNRFRKCRTKSRFMLMTVYANAFRPSKP